MEILLNVLFILLTLAFDSLQLPIYTEDLKDIRNFEIASDDDNVNDEDESEMMQLGDMIGLDQLDEDNNRYRALHSHVEHYNQRVREQKLRFTDTPYVQFHDEEIFRHEEEDEPFIAGFKRDLDNMDNVKHNELRTSSSAYEYDIEQDTTDTYKKSTPIKNNIHETILNEKEVQYVELSTEEYDYEKFKIEYDARVADIVKRNETLNYTNAGELEETPEKVLKNVLDTKHVKNCTSEELEQFGIGAIKCLMHDRQFLKNAATRKKVLIKVWIALRLWLLIYFCVAIPCWCYKGWCCCCCRCKFCFPRKRIELAKRYYVVNPPGVLVKDWDKTETTQPPIKYEAGEFEINAYENLETAIKNL